MAGENTRRAPDERLRPFCAGNARAYLAVLVAWVGVAAVIASTVTALAADQASFLGSFLVTLVAVMAGMAIMFVSSLINLRKLRPGFERLARGEPGVEIPRVWCPVLTSAAQAATRLVNEVTETHRRNTE